MLPHHPQYSCHIPIKAQRTSSTHILRGNSRCTPALTSSASGASPVLSSCISAGVSMEGRRVFIPVASLKAAIGQNRPCPITVIHVVGRAQSGNLLGLQPCSFTGAHSGGSES